MEETLSLLTKEVVNSLRDTSIWKGCFNKKKLLMSITHRSFLYDQDKQLMIDLACRFQESHLHVMDLPYQLSSSALDNAEHVC